MEFNQKIVNFIPILLPTLIRHAQDDPFMTPDVIPLESELSAKTILELSHKGGHVAFIDKNKQTDSDTLCFSMYKQVCEFLKQHSVA